MDFSLKGIEMELVKEAFHDVIGSQWEKLKSEGIEDGVGFTDTMHYLVREHTELFIECVERSNLTGVAAFTHGCLSSGVPTEGIPEMLKKYFVPEGYPAIH